MTDTKHTPTPRRDWVKIGDRCESFAGMFGTVRRIVDPGSVPYAVVKWDSGAEGRHTISTIRRVP